jgi:maltose alpha-D-glucosyltransferase / alpha-amylase
VPLDAAGAHVPLDDDPLWYKHAVVYELSVRAFYDSNADGIGDFAGLTQKLDYLQRLGVNCLWVLPFSPSPMRDGGYDVQDYTGIHPDFGTIADCRRFIRAAHARGIRVIAEMVVNHTSDQHPWFQAARQAPRGSAIRNMYVWSDTDQRYADARIIFTDTERSNWTWDPVAGQYFWHRFFSHQPDLNFASPRVRRAVLNVMRFWFDAGVDGLRLDAVPYLFEREGTNCENLPETHAVLREWRSYVDEHYPGCILLAEANQWPADVIAYFGDGSECHMAFHFPVMPRMFMALRQEDRHPVVDILEQTPPIPDNCQWGLFLRNHDELTLEMVTDEERDYMYSAYAADRKMRVNVGIRRRLAPLLDNNRRAFELLHSLLFSLPGTPILYYGDEIGMGDNWYLGDRDGVRTPMQWTPDRNAGFSQADPARLFFPVIMDPLYGYQAVNVEAQERSASSLLNWMRRLIALRRQRHVLGDGSMEMLDPANRSVLAFIRRSEEQVMLVVANLSRFVQPVELDLASFAGTVPIEVIGGNSFPAIGGDQPYFLAMGPHAFYWFDLQPQPEPAAGGSDAPAIRVRGDWDALFTGEAREQLEREVIPAYLAAQRWFGGKDRVIASVHLRPPVPVLNEGTHAWATVVEVAYDASDGTEAGEVYSLPLAVATGRTARRVAETMPAAVLAPVQGARGQGVLYDAITNDRFCRRLLDLIGERDSARGEQARLDVEQLPAFASLYDALDEEPAIQRSGSEQSNSSVLVGGQLLLKLFRRLESGPHPEIEAGKHFARVGYHGAPQLAASISYVPLVGEHAAFATVHQLVWNQADGWTHALGEVARYFEEGPEEVERAAPGEPPSMPEPQYAVAARTLGARTAEMHRALATPDGDTEFTPEWLTERDRDAVINRIERRLEGLTPALEQMRDDYEAASTILMGAAGLRARLMELVDEVGGLAKIRCHGDYHLGQVLWAKEDFIIVDFEGEVGLPLAERRQKASVLTDVAGMIRSFEYAAAVGLREHLARLTDPEEGRQRLQPLAAYWGERCAAAFLDGYLQALGDAPLLPRDSSLRGWLDVHVLDKALHELEYELGHRPEWVPVPLAAAAALLARLE